jgi:hypothetical protein
MTLEQRVAALEQAVARLEQKAASPDAWMQQVIGCAKDLEGFDEMVRFGREYRESTRPVEGEEGAP